MGEERKPDCIYSEQITCDFGRNQPYAPSYKRPMHVDCSVCVKVMQVLMQREIGVRIGNALQLLAQAMLPASAQFGIAAKQQAKKQFIPAEGDLEEKEQGEGEVK